MQLKRIAKPVKDKDKDNPFWPDTKSLIQNGNITPVISNFVSCDIFGGDAAIISTNWADYLASPLSPQDNRDLARVAHFYSVKTNNREAKRHYLDTLKEFLLGQAQDDPIVDQNLVKKLIDTYEQKTFSDVAYRLGYPKFESEQENPLRLLAELPLPLYLTTSHHDFLEVALSQNSRQAKPVSAIYYWHEGLEHISSIFEDDPDYKPSPNRPLVYHLYGLDTYPESLVLTEDDYLNFLVEITKTISDVYYSDHSDRQKKFQKKQLPSSVLDALRKSLFMLGYGVYDWEFKVLFKGLIQAKSGSRLGESITMQISPALNYDQTPAEAELGAEKNDQVKADLVKQKKEQIEAYLVEYFKQAKFKVFWGNSQECVQKLWEQWEE